MKGPLGSLMKSGLWAKLWPRCFMLLRLTLTAKILNSVPKFVLLRQKSLFAEVSFALQPAVILQQKMSALGCSAADTALRSCHEPYQVRAKG